MKRFCRVHYTQMVMLLAAAVASALDASERSSIESTYELTKYLEYQLKEIKDVYLTYLGPPFNEKDFSPPRPNSTALSLPSAATRLELWHSLENQARLAQNQKAYSILLAAVRELARSTLCPSLKTSLLHFCTGLDGLLGSISALMTTLGYALPATSANMRVMSGDVGRDRPAPLMSAGLYRSRARAESGQRGSMRRTRTRVVRGDEEDAVELVNTDSEVRRAEMPGGRTAGPKERGKRRGKREEPEKWGWDGEKDMQNAGGTKRKLLSLTEEQEFSVSPPGNEIQTNINSNNNNAFSYNLNAPYGDTLRKEDAVFAETGLSVMVTNDAESSSSSSQHHRSPRSLLPSTIPPPLSTLSLLYQFGTGEEHTLLPQPVPLSLRKGLYSPPQRSSPPSSSLSVRPTMNDFARKVEGFWILRELQSWLWRSAKDFNRLKKRL